jgi:hypothetical protein
MLSWKIEILSIQILSIQLIEPLKHKFFLQIFFSIFSIKYFFEIDTNTNIILSFLLLKLDQ